MGLWNNIFDMGKPIQPNSEGKSQKAPKESKQQLSSPFAEDKINTMFLGEGLKNAFNRGLVLELLPPRDDDNFETWLSRLRRALIARGLEITRGIGASDNEKSSFVNNLISEVNKIDKNPDLKKNLRRDFQFFTKRSIKSMGFGSGLTGGDRVDWSKYEARRSSVKPSEPPHFEKREYTASLEIAIENLQRALLSHSFLFASQLDAMKHFVNIYNGSTVNTKTNYLDQAKRIVQSYWNESFARLQRKIKDEDPNANFFVQFFHSVFLREMFDWQQNLQQCPDLLIDRLSFESKFEELLKHRLQEFTVEIQRTVSQLVKNQDLDQPYAWVVLLDQVWTKLDLFMMHLSDEMKLIFSPLLVWQQELYQLSQQVWNSGVGSANNTFKRGPESHLQNYYLIASKALQEKVKSQSTSIDDLERFLELGHRLMITWLDHQYEVSNGSDRPKNQVLADFRQLRQKILRQISEMINREPDPTQKIESLQKVILKLLGASAYQMSLVSSEAHQNKEANLDYFRTALASVLKNYFSNQRSLRQKFIGNNELSEKQKQYLNGLVKSGHLTMEISNRFFDQNIQVDAPFNTAKIK